MAKNGHTKEPRTNPEQSQSCLTEQVSETDDTFCSHATKFQLPVCIQNMFPVSGYDTIDVIVEMDACPTTNPNDKDRMLDYVNQCTLHSLYLKHD